MAQHDADDNDAKPETAGDGTGHAASPVDRNRDKDLRRDPQSEWTASDRRGPMSAAEEEEVERYVPSSEMDGVGDRDHAPVRIVPGDETARSADSDYASPAESVHRPAESANPEAPAADAVHDPALAPPPGAQPSVATSETDATVSPAADAKRPPSRWPIAAGLVIGAIVGAGSAAAVYTYEKTAEAPGSDVAGLTSRLDALENPPLRPQLEALKASLAELQGKVKALQPIGAAPTTTVEAPAAAAPAATPAVAQAPDPELQKTVASLQSGLDSLRGQIADLAKQGAASGDLAGKLSSLETAVGDARKQAEGAQSGLSTIETRQKSLEGKVGAPALAVVADSLVQQIGQGQPYSMQVEALGTLGADPAKIAVLRQNADKGVPSAKALLAKFAPLADPVAATVEKAPANASFWEKLKHGASSIVSVRNANDMSGNDLASRVALIRTDLAHDDVAGALAAWDALPADAKKKSDAWGALAKTSVEAIEAARALQRDAIGALAAKKS